MTQQLHIDQKPVELPQGKQLSHAGDRFGICLEYTQVHALV